MRELCGNHNDKVNECALKCAHYYHAQHFQRALSSEHTND